MSFLKTAICGAEICFLGVPLGTWKNRYLDARKNARLSQAQLAEKIGANKGYISRIERGLIVPSIATFYKIAAAMGLSVELRPN